MTDERIKSYLKDRLKKLEDIKNEREWTTSELGDMVCCKQTLEFIDSLQDEPESEDLKKVVEEIAEPTILNAYGTKELARRLRNTICGTSVSEELDEAAKVFAKVERSDDTEVGYDLNLYCGFVAGAEWKKEHLWKPANGDDLPEINREVIALFDNNKVGYIGYAHRPPEYWDGKNIETGMVTRYYPKTYDKGGWNIPDIKYWLDVELPKAMNDESYI